MKQLGLDYHRTIRAPSQEERLASVEASLRARREARAEARARHLAEPAPSLPTLADHQLGADAPAAIRPESVAAARARRVLTRPLHEVLSSLIRRRFFHGNELAQLFGDGHTARRALALAIRVGWIKRGEFEPTTSQQFLGVGGIEQRHRIQEQYRDELCFGYATVDYPRVDPEYILEMLVGGGVL